MRPTTQVLVSFLATICAASADDNIQFGLRLPPGFEVTEFADSRLANDIFSMTIDPRGRIVVSGRGYIRTLVDDDADGHADRAIEFADGPADGAQGMLWEGTSLFVTGDGGLRRYRDESVDGRADAPSELIRKLKTGGEHEAHDIKRGPDGWLYVLCGNMTGIDESFAQLPTSPIRDPVAGCVLRFSPDLRTSEIIADGFRNAYRMDFNPDGELFTYDSDNERCVSLPWYEPTRFYHVIASGHYGWLAPQRGQFFRLPPYFPDVVAPVATLGRGSPTGVACYRHLQFPETYRGGMFAADWTFGRVYFLPVQRAGASYSSKPVTFIEAVGENGFAPTDLAVHPQSGDLFVAIGGRGTRGAVYRVRYPTGVRSFDPSDLAKLQPAPQRIGWQPNGDELLAEQATAKDELERLRALSMIQRHRSQFTPDRLREITRTNWDHSDRYLRMVTSSLIASLENSDRHALAVAARSPRERLTHWLGAWQDDPASAVGQAGLIRTIRDAEIGASAIRAMQLALGDLGSAKDQGTIWEGYTPRDATLTRSWQAERARMPQGGGQMSYKGLNISYTLAVLGSNFPIGDPQLDRESARVFAMVEDDSPDILKKVIAQITGASNPIDDIHYLAVLARLRAKRSAVTTAVVSRALLDLDHKITERGLNRDRHWPLRVAELHAELARTDPLLNAQMSADAEFGRPDHAVFVQCPGFDRRRAAEIFLARSMRDPDFAWSAALVDLLGNLPESDSLPILRGLWENLGLREAIVQQLGQNPKADDRDKFLDALNSPQLATVGVCLDALKKLPADNDATERLALVRTMRRLRGGKEEDRLRERVGNLLQDRTGQSIAASDADGWTDWLRRTHPELAARLSGPDGVDVAAWNARLEKLDWSAVDADRGRAIFAQTGCITCHSGARAIGPDLRGVASRFSRADLFTAILQPSKDVSPRYQTTLLATADGKLFQGTIIYEAVDSLIVQTGADTTVRVTNSQIVERRATPNSLMPAGLLDRLADQEIVDLYAYLKNLR